MSLLKVRFIRIERSALSVESVRGSRGSGWTRCARSVAKSNRPVPARVAGREGRRRAVGALGASRTNREGRTGGKGTFQGRTAASEGGRLRQSLSHDILLPYAPFPSTFFRSSRALCRRDRISLPISSWIRGPCREKMVTLSPFRSPSRSLRQSREPPRCAKT